MDKLKATLKALRNTKTTKVVSIKIQLWSDDSGSISALNSTDREIAYESFDNLPHLDSILEKLTSKIQLTPAEQWLKENDAQK